MAKCPICGKALREYIEEPFEICQRKVHVDCVPRAIRLERRNAQRERERREQRKLGVYYVNN